MGNRTTVTVRDSKQRLVEQRDYTYNESNQIVTEMIKSGCSTTVKYYSYDADGNRISEMEKVCGRYSTRTAVTYKYDVENRLAAVYEGGELLMAAAYDGDGNRVFQLNYNRDSDEDWDYDSKNRSDVIFPIEDKNGRDGETVEDILSSEGCHPDYELIEYINDVNREYTEVLVEKDYRGKTDTAYIYGVDRLSFDHRNGYSGYYLYDARGSVTGITTEWGDIYQSYRYDAFGDITYGTPEYENEYTYNGESYNPNIESQYLRARYYDVVTASFLTEDSYLGSINEPLTLNRYSYCIGNPENYVDPSGHYFTPIEGMEAHRYLQNYLKTTRSDVQTEMWIENYPYNLSGIGKADIVYKGTRHWEVYEIKPITNKTNILLHISAENQREGYINGLRTTRKLEISKNGKSDVKPIYSGGRTLDSAIEGFSASSALHPTMNIRYEVDDNSPGIIYWYYQKKSKTQMEAEFKKATYLARMALERELYMANENACMIYEDIRERAKKYEFMDSVLFPSSMGFDVFGDNRTSTMMAIYEKYICEPIWEEMRIAASSWYDNQDTYIIGSDNLFDTSMDDGFDNYEQQATTYLGLEIISYFWQMVQLLF